MDRLNVVLMRSGRNVECALNVTAAEAAEWQNAKRREWAQHSPNVPINFGVTLSFTAKQEPYIDWLTR